MNYPIVTAWKVPVFGIFLVRIFPHSDWIRRYTEYLSVFSPNAGKYGPENLRIGILFMQWDVLLHFCDISKAFCDILVYKKGSFVQLTWKKLFIYLLHNRKNRFNGFLWIFWHLQTTKFCHKYESWLMINNLSFWIFTFFFLMLTSSLP